MKVFLPGSYHAGWQVLNKFLSGFILLGSRIVLNDHHPVHCTRKAIVDANCRSAHSSMTIVHRAQKLSFSLGGNKNQGESPLFPLLRLRLNKSTPSSDWCNTALESLDFTGFNHTLSLIHI